VLVETVGVGQSEVEVVGAADTVVVLVAPGAGDAVQVAKAGLLEIGDIYVVNKADRDGADIVVRDLRQAIGVAAAEPGGWARRIVRTTATAGAGVEELLEALDAHAAWSVTSGEAPRRRRARAAAEIEALAVARLRADLESSWSARGRSTVVEELAAEVVAGSLDPWSAVDRLLAAKEG
jgi:LAO/AO transport system kinase